MEDKSDNNINLPPCVLSVQGAIKGTRRGVLDLVQANAGSSKNWNFLRSQLLKLFGDNGLDGNVKKAMEKACPYEAHGRCGKGSGNINGGNDVGAQ